MKLPEHIPVIGAEPGAAARSDQPVVIYPLPPRGGHAHDDRETLVVNCVRKEVHLVIGKELVRFAAFVPDGMTLDQVVEAFTHRLLEAVRSANLGMLE